MIKKQGAAISIASAILLLTAATMAFGQTSSALLPVSDGNYGQFTPKSGTTHYTMVDESSCNGTTDYNYTSTVGHRDSYGLSLSSIPDGATINSITITPCASANKTGSSVMNVFYRWNGTNSSDAGNYSVSGTTPSPKSATAFNGLSLVKSSVSTLEIGAVLTSGSRGLRLGQISAVIDYTPLNAPTNLSAHASSSAGSVWMTWSDNASNEVGFKIERGTDGVNFTQVATVGANVTFYSESGLSEGTYYYRIRAYNAGADSSYSNASSVVVVIAPAAPTDLGGMASSSEGVIYWTDNSDNESGFKIERGTDGVNFTQIATVGINVASYIEHDLTDGTYYYRVRAYNAGGNSDYSNVKNIVIATIPAAPSDLLGFASSSSTFLSWTDNSSNEDGFMLEASSNGVSYYWRRIVPANQNYYVSSLSGTYYYRAYAFNEVGSSTYSNVIIVTR